MHFEVECALQLAGEKCINPLIEQDNLEELKRLLSPFGDTHASGNFLSHAIANKSNKVTQWLINDCKATMPLAWYRLAIREDNAELVQNCLLQKLSTLKITPENPDFNELIDELSLAFPCALNKLPDGQTKTSWQHFYAKHIKPLLNPYIHES